MIEKKFYKIDTKLLLVRNPPEKINGQSVITGEEVIIINAKGISALKHTRKIHTYPIDSAIEVEIEYEMEIFP
jgi:hypothetical protein